MATEMAIFLDTRHLSHEFEPNVYIFAKFRKFCKADHRKIAIPAIRMAMAMPKSNKPMSI